jgi:DNA-dependent RNA polymerase
MLTVNKATVLGVKSFAMIHDSYGTVAADAAIMARKLRAAFVGCEMMCVDLGRLSELELPAWALAIRGQLVRDTAPHRGQ